MVTSLYESKPRFCLFSCINSTQWRDAIFGGRFRANWNKLRPLNEYLRCTHVRGFFLTPAKIGPATLESKRELPRKLVESLAITSFLSMWFNCHFVRSCLYLAREIANEQVGSSVSPNYVSTTPLAVPPASAYISMQIHRIYQCYNQPCKTQTLAKL